MKKDLDALMEQQNMDALLVLGNGNYNPAMVYLTGGSTLEKAILFKKTGRAPVLYHHPIECDEAALTGLETCSIEKYPLPGLLAQTNGNMFKANGLRLKHILQDHGLTSGRLAVYGSTELNQHLPALKFLQSELPGLEICDRPEEDVIRMARMTKDETELSRIRRVSQSVVRIAARLVGFLGGHKVSQNGLCQPDGRPLTIGDVRKKLTAWQAEENIQDLLGSIFALGKDSTVPHNRGKVEDVLVPGQTIVFDYFPAEIGGGYFYDFTRTWCLGYAADETQKIYNDVLDVQLMMLKEIKGGKPMSYYHDRAAEIFEAKGHPTYRSHPGTTEGYIHWLGHGVGLDIHELPANQMTREQQMILPGTVFTIEPGLYYPQSAIGVRIEDTVFTRPDGSIEIFSEFPKELVIPLR